MGTTKFSLVTTRGKYVKNNNPDNKQQWKKKGKISQYGVVNYQLESNSR